ncbi:Penicillin-binding protein 1F [Lentibacillus sp. JNUCC-1]|nr:Penicillin-binding protein 1F [Lentibacillus sp. JNUCC-1]
MITPYTILNIYDQDDEKIVEADLEEKEVFSPQVAWYMTEMLTTAVKEGTGQPGDYDKALAGKTGSTQHPRANKGYKDAWFVGYTPDYVVGTWMGFDHSDETHYLTGGSPYATRLTKAILSDLDQQQSLSASFTKPSDVEKLEEPVELADITQIELNYQFGGLSLVQGELIWEGGTDDRIVYRIYKSEEGEVEQIGEVTGQHSYTIKRLSLFSQVSYYVVPYNPQTNEEGKPSEAVSRSLFDFYQGR